MLGLMCYYSNREIYYLVRIFCLWQEAGRRPLGERTQADATPRGGRWWGEGTTAKRVVACGLVLEIAGELGKLP